MPKSWLLPEDGEIDEIAVEVAVAGLRPVMLTPLERRAAAALILASGYNTDELAARLHMRNGDACVLAREVRDDSGLAAAAAGAAAALEASHAAAEAFAGAPGTVEIAS